MFALNGFTLERRVTFLDVSVLFDIGMYSTDNYIPCLLKIEIVF